MHELAFADAVRPSPVVVLKTPLCDYSLGHELLLLRRRNALLLTDHAGFSRLPLASQIYSVGEAVWICSDTYSQRDSFENPSSVGWGYWWSNFKLKIWSRRLRKIEPSDLALAVAEFRNYLEAGRSFPPQPDKEAGEIANGEQDGSNTGRASGCPLLLSMYQHLNTIMSFPTKRHASAWDYPFGAAAWIYLGHLESEGRIRIENMKEAEIKQEMAEHRAAIAKESKEGDNG